MSLRGLRLATQFLTRLPVPAVENLSPDELSKAAPWFPLVGLVLGVVMAVILHVVSLRSVGLGAAVGLLAWIWITGALHLDGLADLSDALGAAHRDPQKFLTVLADPHVGTFGVVSITLMLILKVTGLAQLPATATTALALVPAWARLGPLAWSRWLAPLKPGQAATFASHLHMGWIVFWTVTLLAASAALAPVLCLAPLIIAGWGWWLKWRLGGTTGDCLGAGIEVTELVLLYVLVVFGTASGTLAGLQ